MKVMEYLSQKFKDLLYSEMRQYLPYCLHCSVDVVDTAQHYSVRSCFLPESLACKTSFCFGTWLSQHSLIATSGSICSQPQKIVST